jgi:hypothetical protein
MWKWRESLQLSFCVIDIFAVVDVAVVVIVFIVVVVVVELPWIQITYPNLLLPYQANLISPNLM